jgi:hypothetical protein
MHRQRIRTTPRRGGAALEAALVLPVLITVLVGLTEVGWVFHGQQAVERAVRFGCRDGAVAPSPSDPASVAAEAMDTHLEEAGFSCPPEGCSAEVELGWSAGEPFLSCNLTAPHSPLTGLIPGLDRIELDAGTRNRVERTDP